MNRFACFGGPAKRKPEPILEESELSSELAAPPPRQPTPPPPDPRLVKREAIQATWQRMQGSDAEATAAAAKKLRSYTRDADADSVELLLRLTCETEGLFDLTPAARRERIRLLELLVSSQCPQQAAALSPPNVASIGTYLHACFQETQLDDQLGVAEAVGDVAANLAAAGAGPLPCELASNLLLRHCFEGLSDPRTEVQDCAALGLGQMLPFIATMSTSLIKTMLKHLNGSSFHAKASLIKTLASHSGRGPMELDGLVATDSAAMSPYLMHLVGGPQSHLPASGLVAALGGGDAAARAAAAEALQAAAVAFGPRVDLAQATLPLSDRRRPSNRAMAALQRALHDKVRAVREAAGAALAVFQDLQDFFRGASEEAAAWDEFVEPRVEARWRTAGPAARAAAAARPSGASSSPGSSLTRGAGTGLPVPGALPPHADASMHKVNAWLHTPTSNGSSPPEATSTLTGAASGPLLAPIDLNGGGSNLGSSPLLYGSSPAQFYSAPEDVSGVQHQRFDGPGVMPMSAPPRSVGFNAVADTPAGAQEAAAAAAGSANQSTAADGQTFGLPGHLQPEPQPQSPLLTPDLQVALDGKAAAGSDLFSVQPTAAASTEAREEAGASGAPVASLSVPSYRSAPSTPAMRPEEHPAGARLRATSEQQLPAVPLPPATSQAAPLAAADRANAAPLAAEAAELPAGRAAAPAAFEAAQPAMQQPAAREWHSRAQPALPPQQLPQLSAIDQRLQAAAPSNLDVHAYTMGYRAAEAAMQQQLEARNAELGNLQATMDAFIRSSAQQQAATTQRLAAMERLLAQFNLPLGVTQPTTTAAAPADGLGFEPLRQLQSASAPAESASPFGSPEAQRLSVAHVAAANGGTAFSDDDGSVPSAASSLDDDPLSPGSRAHVESMYQEALSADDGNVRLLQLMAMLGPVWDDLRAPTSQAMLRQLTAMLHRQEALQLVLPWFSALTRNSKAAARLELSAESRAAILAALTASLSAMAPADAAQSQGRQLHEQGRELHEQLTVRWGNADTASRAAVPSSSQPLPSPPDALAAPGNDDPAMQQAAEPPTEAALVPDQDLHAAGTGDAHPAAAVQPVVAPEQTAGVNPSGPHSAVHASGQATAAVQPAASVAAVAAPDEPAAASAAAGQPPAAGNIQASNADDVGQSGLDAKTTLATHLAAANGDEKAAHDWLKPPAAS